jgi:mRNA-degrading endonuclease RelE of RelBE toxin-antitoxin system
MRLHVKKLAKKYRSIKQDVAALARQLENNPIIGDEVIKDCYKIRMSIASKGKGKSGGARVITYVFINHTTVFLLSVYDKSDQVDIGIKELHQLVKEIA